MQDFLVGGRTTVIDSERHLCCLSLKPTFRFVAMSFFPSFSQMIWGTIGSTSVSCAISAKDKSAEESCSVLATEKDTEEAEIDKDANG